MRAPASMPSVLLHLRPPVQLHVFIPFSQLGRLHQCLPGRLACCPQLHLRLPACSHGCRTGPMAASLHPCLPSKPLAFISACRPASVPCHFVSSRIRAYQSAATAAGLYPSLPVRSSACQPASMLLPVPACLVRFPVIVSANSSAPISPQPWLRHCTRDRQYVCLTVSQPAVIISTRLPASRPCHRVSKCINAHLRTAKAYGLRPLPPPCMSACKPACVLQSPPTCFSLVVVAPNVFMPISLQQRLPGCIRGRQSASPPAVQPAGFH